MSRELRFRAWHKESREMLYASPADIFIWQHEEQPIEIMQFTGLLDKQGKEIYESDIVRLHSQHNESYLTTVTCENLIEGNSSFCEMEFDDCEIIGNLYETPELLNAEER